MLKRIFFPLSLYSFLFPRASNILGIWKMNLGIEKDNKLYLYMHRQITGSNGQALVWIGPSLYSRWDTGTWCAWREKWAQPRGPVIRQLELRILYTPSGLGPGSTQHEKEDYRRASSRTPRVPSREIPYKSWRITRSIQWQYLSLYYCQIRFVENPATNRSPTRTWWAFQNIFRHHAVTKLPFEQ